MSVKDACPTRDKMSSNRGEKVHPTELVFGVEGHHHPGVAQSLREQSFVQENDIDVDILRPLQTQHQIVQLILGSRPKVTRGEMSNPHRFSHARFVIPLGRTTYLTNPIGPLVFTMTWSYNSVPTEA